MTVDIASCIYYVCTWGHATRYCGRLGRRLRQMVACCIGIIKPDLTKLAIRVLAVNWFFLTSGCKTLSHIYDIAPTLLGITTLVIIKRHGSASK
jgi:hypothetical protein